MTRLVVVGDALLDVDTVGRVERVSPDAPVPVVDVEEHRVRPGGAALAAWLAARDGHRVTLVAAVADDADGERLRRSLGGTVELVALPTDGSTVVKQRVRAGGQSLVRLDSGRSGQLLAMSAETTAALDRAMDRADAVLVSDYGHGISATPALRDLLAASAPRLPVVWDPHPRGARAVAGVRLVTPNEAEARTLTQPVPGTGLTAVAGHAGVLLRDWRAGAVAVTMGARGALLSYGEGAPAVVDAPAVSGGDSCGAGDRFASAAAVALGTGAVTAEAVRAAVVSASEFVAAGGAAAALGAASPPRPVAGSAAELVRRVRAGRGVVVATGGCFDLLHPGHLATLEAARRLGDCLVVCLNSDASVRRLKGPGRPVMRAADRARLLAALECVDAVEIFDEDTPVEVLRRLRPDVWTKGGDYAGTDLPEAAVLSGWGGQAVVLPYVDGHSTTALVQVAVQS